MNILVVNAGSTSLKFKLFTMPQETVLAECRIERIGEAGRGLFHYANPSKGYQVSLDAQSFLTYTQGIERFLTQLTDPSVGALDSLAEIERVGFKTVLAKGFLGVHVLNDAVLEGMEAYRLVAPAHNGPYLEVIRLLRPMMPDACFIGAFETDFHKDIPLERRLYGVPYAWYECYGVQRMGYHGASHAYVADFVAQARGGQTGRLVSCHLGGSGSLCAVLDGRSVDTSFGFSLQTGLIQSSRVGDLDAFIVPYMVGQGMPLEAVNRALCTESGLKGLSGVSGDLRDIEQAAQSGHERAMLALAVYINGIVKYIGAFAAEMGGLDAVAFAGGIGEHSAFVRRGVCRAFGYLGLALDASLNEASPKNARISAADSRVAVYLVATDEECVVARKTYAVAP